MPSFPITSSRSRRLRRLQTDLNMLLELAAYHNFILKLPVSSYWGCSGSHANLLKQGVSLLISATTLTDDVTSCLLFFTTSVDFHSALLPHLKHFTVSSDVLLNAPFPRLASGFLCVWHLLKLSIILLQQRRMTMPSKSPEQMISFGFIPVFPQQRLKGCTGSVIYSQTSAFQQDLTPFFKDIMLLYTFVERRNMLHFMVMSWLV